MLDCSTGSEQCRGVYTTVTNFEDDDTDDEV